MRLGPALALLLLQDPATLSLKFAKGQKMRYLRRLESAAELEGARGTTLHETTTTFEVLDVAESGEGKLRATFDRFRVETTGPMGEKKFDSDAPEDLRRAREDPELRLYAALRGRSVLMRVGSRGKVEQTDVGEMVRALEAEPDLKPIADEARKIGDRLVQASFCSLPDRPVRPGEAWKDAHSMEMPGAGLVVMEGRHTLESVQEGVARIAVEIAIRLEKDAPDGLAIREGSGRGLVLFDVASGAMVGSKTATRLVVERAARDGQVRRVVLDQKSQTSRP
jgi:hypothetical protein